MNKIVAVTALAATPVASPSIAAGLPALAPTLPAIDKSPAACLRRAEEAVDLLRTRSIRPGWKIDEEAAERALAYCRKYAEFGPDPDEYQDGIEFREAADFFRDHGISIDWVFDDDIGGLICRCAHHSPRANSLASAGQPEPIFAAIEAHRAAYEAFENCCVKQDGLQDVIPKDRRRSSFCDFVAYDEPDALLETDDPAWLAYMREFKAVAKAEEQAAIDLVSTKKLTPAGALALLKYTLYREERGDVWPAGLADEHDRSRSWEYFLMRQIAEALEALTLA